jgi:hypothetical protein
MNQNINQISKDAKKIQSTFDKLVQNWAPLKCQTKF